jgi:hypothetical protein
LVPELTDLDATFEKPRPRNFDVRYDEIDIAD